MNQNYKIKAPLTIESIICEKGEEWRKTFSYIKSTIPDKFLSEKNLIRLTKGAATISQTELMAKLLYKDMKERPTGVPGIVLFFKVVDHSNYSLGDWLIVIDYFHQWLLENNRTFSFQKMLGYLQCCEDSPENKLIEHLFIDLVKEMIHTHGYVG